VRVARTAVFPLTVPRSPSPPTTIPPTEGEAVPRIYTADAAGGEPHPIADASGYLTD
jgi:hypothetical protein